MNYEVLKNKCLYYRDITDYRLIPHAYIMIMLDGRCFSKLIKNKFEKPFDKEFINMMNETATYLCSHIQCAKFAYVQSDEISVLLSDYEEDVTTFTKPWFDYRLSKILSITASLASSKFNQLLMAKSLKDGNNIDDVLQLKLIQFDSKAWNLPNKNEVLNWFIFRQLDCVRNSKQMAAQAYLPSKQLFKHTADQQIEMLLNEKNVNWNDYDDGMKFGRFVYRVEKEVHSDLYGDYVRNFWDAFDAFPIMNDRNKLNKIIFP